MISIETDKIEHCPDCKIVAIKLVPILPHGIGKKVCKTCKKNILKNLPPIKIKKNSEGVNELEKKFDNIRDSWNPKRSRKEVRNISLGGTA